MAGAVSADIINDMLIRISGDASNLMSTVKQAQAAMEGLGKKTNINLDIRKQFGQIEQFAKLTGDATKGVGEKISLVSNGLKTLVQNGKGATDGAKNLASRLAILKKEAIVGDGAFKSIAGNLANRLIPGFSQASGAVGQLKMAYPQMAALAGTATVAVAALAAAYKYVVIPGVNFNSMLEQQSVAFTSMLKSGAKANAMLDELKKLSLTTPIGLGEGASSAKQMLAYGFAQSEIVDNLKLMKTVAGAVNVSLSDLTYVYGTLRAQGRAYTRDLMQFGMRGIPIYEYLASTLNVSVDQIKGMTEAGSIGFKEVEAAMKAMTGEGGKFDGMLERSMMTTEGLKTQIANTWQMFTGATAQGTSAIFKDLLKDILSLVRSLNDLAPSFNAVFSVISFLLAQLIKAFIALEQPYIFLDKLLQNIVLSIIDLISWTAQWLDKTIGISKAFNSMDDTLADTGSSVLTWLRETVPLVNTILDQTKKIENAIEGWWNRDKNKNKEPMLDMVVGEYSAFIKNSPKIMEQIQKYQALAQQSGGKLPVKEMGDFADTVGISVEELYRGIAVNLSMSQKTFDDYVRNTKATMNISRNYWKVYAEDVNDIMVQRFLSKGTPVTDALKKVEDDLREAFKYGETLDMAKLLGFNADETKDALKKPSQEIADELYRQIVKMRDLLVYKSGEGKTFLDGLIAMWQKYNQEAEKAGAKAKKSTVFDDFLQQYLEFRADWATVESGFSDDLVNALNTRLDPLNYTTGILGDLSMLDRQLALIDQKYDEIAKSMTNEEWAVAGQAVNEMRDMEKAAARLNDELKRIQDNLAVNMDPQKTTALLKREYEIEVQLSKLKTLTDEERISNMIKQIELEQKLVDIMLQGDQDAYKRANNRMIVQGQASGQYDQVAEGLARNATAGMDIGKLAAGADPITMLISSFIEMAMSIENVSKVLNFFGTIMDGIKSMIEGPTNEALKTVVLLLTKVGEAVGALLVPIIEVAGDLLDTFAAPLAIVAEILKRFFQAIKPLIKLFLYLNNPIAWIGHLFGQLADALGAFLSTETDHQKDLEDLYARELATLQNLYEVGALSGAEYEARLAELKARYAKDAPATEADPYLVQILTDVFDALTEMGVALNELFVALTPLIDTVVAIMVPLLRPLLALLLSVLTGFFKDVAKIVTAVSGLVTSLLSGDWSTAGEYLAAAFKAVAGFFINPLLRIFNWISTLIADVGNWLVLGSDPFEAFTVSELAVGSGNIPSNMLSMLHRGEAVVPKTFMDAIRSGELALTGGGAGGGTIVVNVYNEGSVIAERDLQKSIYTGIASLKKKGYV